MNRLVVRNPSIVCVSKGDYCHFLRPDGTHLSIVLQGAAEISHALELLSVPVAAEDTQDIIDDSTLRRLIATQVLIEGTEEGLSRRLGTSGQAFQPCGTLVFCVTGGIAAIHAATIVYELFHNFALCIEVVLSKPARRLVSPNAFTSLGIRVWTDVATPQAGVNVPHVHLAKEANMIVVWPASAHAVHRIANGTCSDLTSLVIAASRAPVVLVPAMNQRMWSNPAVARNIARVRGDGYYVIEPRMGIEVANKRVPVREYGNPGVDLFAFCRTLKGILGLDRLHESDESGKDALV